MLYKSILFSPITNEKLVEKVLTFEPDSVVLDLEDSVSMEKKQLARDLLKNTCQQMKKIKIDFGIRINQITSINGLNDIITLRNDKLEPNYLVLPMVESAEEIIIVQKLINNKTIKIVPVIETAKALLNCQEISKLADALFFGSADYSASVGTSLSWDNNLYARNVIVNCAASNNIPAFDSACFEINDFCCLETEAEKCSSLGFYGKAAVHPKQISLINKVFSVDENTLQEAQNIINNKNIEVNGVAVLDGKFLGPPWVKMAQKIVSKEMGVTNE